ncbi:hypothetical protein NHF40_12540 [Maricaulaceae bacterium EIL42A08]|nr:hypothetical protein [Maricaulaceae bacterium EIL42A08]
MPTGRGDLESTLGGFLTSNITQIRDAGAVIKLAWSRASQHLTPFEMIDQLNE